MGIKDGDTNHNAIVKLSATTNNFAAIFNPISARNFLSVPPSTILINCVLNGMITRSPTSPKREIMWNIRATALIPGLTQVDNTTIESENSSNMLVDQLYIILFRCVRVTPRGPHTVSHLRFPLCWVLQVTEFEFTPIS